IEEGTALPVIRQGRQIGIDAGDESTCAIVEAVGFRRPRLVLVFRRHLIPDSRSAGFEKMATLCSRTFQLHFVVRRGYVQLPREILLTRAAHSIATSEIGFSTAECRVYRPSERPRCTCLTKTRPSTRPTTQSWPIKSGVIGLRTSS